jgi:nitrogen fixation protein FixH
MTNKFTGRHMAFILIGFFGIVMAVNFTMARYASSTFGGTVVDNSYVASQKFNGWLAEARKERALGWSIAATHGANGRVIATLHGLEDVSDAANITATARHPLGLQPDVQLTFRQIGPGTYESVQPLPTGRWTLHVRANREGQQVTKLIDLQ